MKKTVLVDGNSLLFRAFFATQYGSTGMMQTSFGVTTNAIFAFSQMILKCIEQENPDYMLVAFDAGKCTFRHQMYNQYKGTRKETPSELVQQFTIAREFLDALGIKHYESDAYEADDIVGTMAKLSNKEGEVSIFTSDRDLLQCVSDQCSVHLLIKGMGEQQIMTPTTLQEIMDLTPPQIIDFKSLVGDTSDNIPGLPGVGKVSAMKLIHQYGSLEKILNHKDEIKGKVGETIRNNVDLALTYQKLVTIKTDCDLPFSLQDCALNPNYSTLYDFFIKYEMHKLADKISSKICLNDVNIKQETLVECTVVKTVSPSLLVTNQSLIVDRDNALLGSITIYGFAIGNTENKEYIYFEDALKDALFMQWVQSENEKIIYDAKSAIVALSQFGINLNGISEDPMILASLADSSATSSAKIAQRFNLKNNLSLEQLYGKFDKPKLADSELQLKYCAYVIDDNYELLNQCLPILKSFDCLNLYYEIELPLISILAKMEIEGIECKKDILNAIASDLSTQMNTLQSKIFEVSGKEFNINSPKQLASILFDDLALPTTNNKKRSTSADVLESLVNVHPIIEYLIRYRKLGKIYSTYAMGLEKYIGKDQRIHTTFNQAATQTGRLSSSDPNLQNISVRDEEGKVIRKAFVAKEGYVLLSCDYSQVELRMLAHMAKEQRLIEAFQQGLDIHTSTAMNVFGLSFDEVTSQHRRQAKAVNFGIVYGISDFGLATQLGISRKEAQEFIDRYLQTYPGIKAYMDEIIDFCEHHGYVATITHRRREIPEIYDKSFTMRSFGKRAAMNAPIQGSAADLIKIAMIKVNEAMKKANVESKLLLQVHDELIFEVKEEEQALMEKLVQETMESAMELSVPLKADCNVGKDWYEAK